MCKPCVCNYIRICVSICHALNASLRFINGSCIAHSLMIHVQVSLRIGLSQHAFIHAIIVYQPCLATLTYMRGPFVRHNYFLCKGLGVALLLAQWKIMVADWASPVVTPFAYVLATHRLLHPCQCMRAILQSRR